MSGSQSSPPSNSSGSSNPIYRNMSRNLKQSLCSQVLTSAEDVVEQTNRHVDEFAARGQRGLLNQQEQRKMLQQSSDIATGKSVHKPSRKYVQVQSSGYGQARRPSSGRIPHSVDPDYNSSNRSGITDQRTTRKPDKVEVHMAGVRSNGNLSQDQHANQQQQQQPYQQQQSQQQPRQRGALTNSMLYDDAYRARIYVANEQLKKVENERFATFKREQELYSVPMLDIDAYPSDDDSTVVLTPREIKVKYVYNDPSGPSTNGGRGRKGKGNRMHSGNTTAGSSDIRNTPRGSSSGNNTSAVTVQVASKRGQVYAQHAQNERSRSTGSQQVGRGNDRQSNHNDRGRHNKRQSTTFVSGAV